MNLFGSMNNLLLSPLDCNAIQNSNGRKIKYLSKLYDIFPLILISSSYKSSIFTSYLQEGSSLVHFTFCIFLKTNKKQAHKN